jgi:hypothetical protein
MIFAVSGIFNGGMSGVKFICNKSLCFSLSGGE